MYMATGSKRAVLYARVSLDRTGDSESPDRQIAECRKFVKGQGWTVAGAFIDRNVSAFSGVARPDYEACLDMLRRGEADVMVAWKLDRVQRDTEQFSQLTKLFAETGTHLVTVVDRIDTSESSQLVFADILAALAANESRNIAVRLGASITAAARRGEPRSGGSRPFGYEQYPPKGSGSKETRTLRIVEEEAEIVRWLASEIIAGRSVNSLCVELNERGIKTTTGKTWGPTTLIRYFRSHTVAGLREDKGEMFKGNWPTIVDAATLARVRARLARNSKGKESTVVGLLSGIARCGRCDAPLTYARRIKGDKLVANYTCSKSAKNPDRCNRLGIAVAPTDELVTGLLFDRLESVRNRRDDSDRDAEIALVVRELEDQNARLEEITADYYADRQITKSVFESVAGQIARRIDALRSELDALREAVPRVEVEDVRSWWETATLTEKRDLLRQHIEALPIAPSGRTGNQYRPQRVTAGLRWHS